MSTINFVKLVMENATWTDDLSAIIADAALRGHLVIPVKTPLEDVVLIIIPGGPHSTQFVNHTHDFIRDESVN